MKTFPINLSFEFFKLIYRDYGRPGFSSLKWSMRFLIFFMVMSFYVQADGPSFCSMGDYQYTGKIYNDSYAMNRSEGQITCQRRDQLDEKQIGVDYKNIRAGINGQIDKMLNDPGCVETWPHLNEYRLRLASHWMKFDSLTKERIRILERISQKMDMQKAFALLGAFNATCSGGQNRKSAFINLDLINNLPVIYGKTEFKKDGEVAQDCSDVSAAGSDDLKSFKVSMKKAQGSTFNFLWDPYSIPDQVIVKNGSGSVLFDSGCKGVDGSAIFQPIALDGVNGGEVEVNVINNCDSPSREKGVSSWQLRIQCQKEPEPKCQDPREELMRLLKMEIELIKLLMDANSLHRSCLFFMDENLLNDLISEGLIKIEDGPLTNGFCETGDIQCEEKNEIERLKERKNIEPLMPYRDPSSDQDQFRCPEKSDDEESIFSQISRAYCRVGWRRLGVEPTLNDLK